MHSLNSTSGASLSFSPLLWRRFILQLVEARMEARNQRANEFYRPTGHSVVPETRPSNRSSLLFPSCAVAWRSNPICPIPLGFILYLNNTKGESLPLRANGATFALIIYASWEICQTLFLLLFSSSSSSSSSFLGFWLTALWQGHGQPGSVARFFRTMIQGERERNGMV